MTMDTQAIQQEIDVFRRRRLEVLMETAHEQYAEERKLITRYRKRELFGLLQTAVDRADHHVVVMFDAEQGHFVVANDARPVSIDPAPGRPPRIDVEGLCSVNTSRKEAREAIGNKGLGFKIGLWRCPLRGVEQALNHGVAPISLGDVRQAAFKALGLN